MKILLKSIIQINNNTTKLFITIFLFLFISLFDFFSISLVPIIFSKFLDTNVQIPFLDIFDQTFLRNINNLIFFFISLFFIKFFLSILIYYFYFKNAYSLRNEILVKIYQNILFSKKKIKLSQSSNFIKIVDNFINGVYIPIIQISFEILVFLLTIVYLSIWNFKLTFICLIIIFLYLFLYISLIRKKIYLLGKGFVQINEALFKYINYANTGYREIIIYSKENNFFNLINNKLKDLKSLSIHFDLLNLLPRLSIEIIFIFILLVIFFLSKGNNFFLINLSVYGFAFFKLAPSSTKILNLTNSIRYGSFSVGVIHEEISKKIEFQKKSLNKKQFTSLKLNNITYELPESRQILTFKNFEIYKGDKVLIYGKSGAGKSTLLDILCGFKKQTSGDIVLNGSSKKPNLANFATYLPRDILILENSYKNNILLNFDEKNMNKKINYNHDIIQFKKDLINSNAISNLSSGETKRLGINRVLNSSKQVLLLDEPTAGLDLDTENKIIEYLGNLKNKTLIIVSHQLNFKKICNKIVKI